MSSTRPVDAAAAPTANSAHLARESARADVAPHLILYDGVCGLCDHFVQFILARDTHDRFRFAPLQGTVARDALARHAADPSDLDTVCVLRSFGEPGEVLLVRGRAILFALATLGGAWALLAAIAGVLPTFVIDLGYRAVASLRYRVFGRLDHCAVPNAQQRTKFLE